MRKTVFVKLAILLALMILICIMPSVVHADDATPITTYAELVTAFSNGGKAKLNANITMTGNSAVRQPLELDLNGYTIDGAKTIISYSDLTIKDSSSGKTGKITTTGSWLIQLGGSGNTGNLNIESGNFECKGSYGIRVNANCNFTMNGGTITGKSYVVYNQGTFNINGGNVLASDGMAVQNHNNSIFTMNNGKIETLANSTAINFYGYGEGTINNGDVIALYQDPSERKGGVSFTVFKYSTVTINGGNFHSYGCTLMGNGSTSGTNEGTGVKFYINGGTFLSDVGTAIYAPQASGETIITAGVFTGARSGIEVRAGDLTITGGTFNGNQNEYDVTENKNGITTKGAAVAVVQHTTKQPINVTITGGTFNAYVPFSEDNSLENPPEDIEKISYDISGGTFNSSSNQTVRVEDFQEKFISGGKYTHLVTQYVKDGYGEKPEDSMDAVYKWRTIKLNQDHGNTTITRKKTISDNGINIITEDDITSTTQVQALYGDEIYLTIEPNEGYRLLSINGKTTEGNKIRISGGEFKSIDSDMNINLKYVKLITTAIDLSKDVDKVEIGTQNDKNTNEAIIEALNNESNNIQFESDPIVELVIEEKEMSETERKAIIKEIGKSDATIVKLYDIYIVVKDEAGNELGRITELPKELEFAIKLPNDIAKVPDGYKRTYNVVRNHNIYEIIDNELSNDGFVIKFKSDKFSNFAIVYVEENTEDLKKTPNTGDHLIIYVTVLMIGIAGLEATTAILAFDKKRL